VAGFKKINAGGNAIENGRPDKLILPVSTGIEELT
jgi:hypothetical protein